MDINNDKEIINEEETLQSSVTEEEEAKELLIENIEEAAEVQDAETFDEDVFEDFESFGELTEELSEMPEENKAAQKKTFLIQKPVFIAIIAFMLTAVIAFGSFIVYDIIEKNKEELTVAGVWAPAQSADSGYYYVFGDDGTFSVNLGGNVLTGTYTTEDIEAQGTESAGETETYSVITLNPCVFSDYESQAILTLSEDKDTLTLTFIYSGSVNLVRTELPEHKIDASEITHASADEVGLDSLSIDDEIVGSWSTEVYTGVKETYTFYENGIGKATDEFIDGGYSITTNFKYTTKDGKIYLTIELFNGNTSDVEMNYYMDNGKLVLNNLAYEAVK